jgi:hypothetical protein
MRRLLLLGLFLLLAAPAAAKEVKSLEVCGQDRCVPIDKTDEAMIGGAEVPGPPDAGGFVNMNIAMDAGSGHVERFTVRFVPDVGLSLGLDGTWFEPPPAVVKALRNAAAKVELLPARRIADYLTPAEMPTTAPAPATQQPAAPDDGGPSFWLFFGLACLALVVAIAIMGVRRRPASAP